MIKRWNKQTKITPSEYLDQTFQSFITAETTAVDKKIIFYTAWQWWCQNVDSGLMTITQAVRGRGEGGGCEGGRLSSPPDWIVMYYFSQCLTYWAICFLSRMCLQIRDYWDKYNYTCYT